MAESVSVNNSFRVSRQHQKSTTEETIRINDYTVNHIQITEHGETRGNFSMWSSEFVGRVFVDYKIARDNSKMILSPPRDDSKRPLTASGVNLYGSPEMRILTVAAEYIAKDKKDKMELDSDDKSLRFYLETGKADKNVELELRGFTRRDSQAY